MAQKPPLPHSAEAITVEWIQQAFAAGGAADLPALRGMAVENIGAGGVSALSRGIYVYKKLLWI